MIQTSILHDERLARLRRQGERWCLGSPGTAAVRLLYGLATVEPGSTWRIDSRTRSDLLALPVISLAWVLRGEVEAEIAGEVSTAREGDMLCHPVPGENAMRARGGSGNAHAYVIIHHDYVTRRLAPLVRAGRIVRAEAAPMLEAVFDRIFERGLAGRYADPAEEEIDLFAFARTLEGCLGDTDTSLAQGRAMLQSVERLVLASLPRRPTVGELAEALQMSEGHLLRRFRRLTGATPGSFVTRLQLDEAARLLTETRLPLKSVAARVGFSDEQALAHAFRRHRGRTAGSLRNGEPGPGHVTNPARWAGPVT